MKIKNKQKQLSCINDESLAGSFQKPVFVLCVYYIPNCITMNIWIGIIVNILLMVGRAEFRI